MNIQSVVYAGFMKVLVALNLVKEILKNMVLQHLKKEPIDILSLSSLGCCFAFSVSRRDGIVGFVSGGEFHPFAVVADITDQTGLEVSRRSKEISRVWSVSGVYFNKGGTTPA